ncbi:HlyD family type I secretion periplasmic adaptor subunit [Vineibacter terrae]|nr:HlyD family type I secretion periplasmic adaptor subunit [Vineibacter terrae]
MAQTLQQWWQQVLSLIATWCDSLLDFLRSATLDDLVSLAMREWPLILAVGVALLWLAASRRRTHGIDAAGLAAMIRGPRALGYAVGVAFFGGLAAWSWIAPLASAAIAPGVVSPDGHRKTVQHLEGGIIRAIHVREGDVVAVGDRLVTLEETQARAKLDEMRERYVHLLTAEARLIAEQSGAEQIAFPPEITVNATVGTRRAMTSQVDLLGSRRATQQGKERILTQRIRQSEEEIAGLRKIIAAQATQLQLLDREIVIVRKLYEQGIERLPRLLALERTQAEVRGEQANNEARIARIQQQIGETEIQLLTMRDQDKERANDELTKVREQLAVLRSELPGREDILTRTVIQAPIAGVVMNVKVTTEAGVVGPGQALLDIVPGEAKLIIDARLKPNDIDVVQPGMRARVLLTAYRQRVMPQIFGTLRSASADRLVDDRTGEAYFLAKIEVDADDIARLKDVRLAPGMSAEVMILTGERTVMDYLLRPLIESFIKSFRES